MGAPSRSKRRWKLRALVALFLLGTGLILYDFARFAGVCSYYARLARRGYRLVSVPVSSNEAIVGLTGDQGRIPKALDLLRYRGTPLLITSGTGKAATRKDLVNMQGHSAVNIQTVWKKILLEPRSGSTIENAEESGKLLLQNGIRRVILVTSEYHMLRALRIFKSVMPRLEIIA